MSNNNIGDRLKIVRGSTSLPAFAKQFNIHRNTLGRYERGEGQPDAKFLQQICSEFDLSPTWLLIGDGPMRLTGLDEENEKSQYFERGRNLDQDETKRDSALEHIQVPAEEFKMSEMITKTVEVLESNTIYRTALASNINAFHHSINMIVQIDRLESTVARMETDSKETQSRMSSMEKQMSALLGEINDMKAAQTSTEQEDDRQVANGH